MLESSGRPDGVALPSRTAPPRSGQCDRAYRHTEPAGPPSATREGPPGAPDAPITIGPLLDRGRVAPQGGRPMTAAQVAIASPHLTGCCTGAMPPNHEAHQESSSRLSDTRGS